MIITLKDGASQKEVSELENWIVAQGMKVHKSKGEKTTILGLIGETQKLDTSVIQALDIVESVTRVLEPYKEANRKYHPKDTVIELENGVKIGGNNFTVMAGPCSVESEEQIVELAKQMKASGAQVLRGGAFKPRSSPYSFQGKGEEGIEFMIKAREATGLPIVTEIMDASHLPAFKEVDILQVGARNMQNYTLLKALGEVDKPVLLKRGFSATYEEWLMSAEYIMSGGNKQVILCERGIRTFETGTRNTLDISAVPMIKKKSHLPIVVDPSHAAGLSWMVEPLALAATGAGAHGLMIEVHNDPQHALSDGPQSLKPEEFSDLMKKTMQIRKVVQGLEE